MSKSEKKLLKINNEKEIRHLIGTCWVFPNRLKRKKNCTTAHVLGQKRNEKSWKSGREKNLLSSTSVGSGEPLLVQSFNSINVQRLNKNVILLASKLERIATMWIE